MAGTYDALRAQTLRSGKDEEAVTVNTRALIDKVLARYSGEHTMLRELLQNAADANATSVEIRYDTIPSSGYVEPGHDEYKALLKAKCQRLTVKNDGVAFREEDWQRLKRIAEGNPDDQKIGAFGVGFYSVFADCEEPFVSSGSECMAFYWKGNSLFTRRAKVDKHDPSTVFLLENREPSDLPDLKTLSRFLATSITFVSLSTIKVYIDDLLVLNLKKKPSPALELEMPSTLRASTSGEIFKIQEITTERIQIDCDFMQLVQYEPTVASELASGVQSFRSFFSKFSSQPQKQATTQNLSERKSATIFFRIATASLSVSIPAKVSQELERATKKPPPKRTKLSILSMSKAELDASERGVGMFENILPDKEGRIFIGFPTHQTTSLKAHISASSVIPTVERESIDLNAKIVKTWNAELLQCAGILARNIYKDEMDTLQRQARGLDTKELEVLYSTAIHILNQFTFTTATPSADVGKYIEHGFWTCSKDRSIELLSSRGVLASSKVRTATELGFLDDLAILPKQVEEGAPAFIETLKSFGWLSEVTVKDIHTALDKKALSKGQALAFLKWLANQRTKRLIDKEVALSLLEVAVVMDDKSNEPIALAGIRYALDPAKFPVDSIPLPPDCAPFALTKSLSNGDLSAIGWTYMDLPHWIGYLCNGTLDLEYDVQLNPDFAQRMLLVISKNWSHLVPAARLKIADLLKDKTCIVTKMGMKRPDEAYIEKVRLFDDLPIVVPYSGVKSNVLAELGVRKTVELRLIFDRLMSEDTAAQWSHVDLIKYLCSVRSDIPKKELEMLKKSPTCLAEGSTERHAIKDLYVPDNNLRALGLPVIAWPDEWRPNSAEVRFLESLGIKKHPNVEELLVLASNVSDVQRRAGALRYLIANYYSNFYNDTDPAIYHKYAFLPGENSEKGKLYTPREVFTNRNVALFGYPLLSSDLVEHGQRFGVRADPPIDSAVANLLNSPPRTPADATKKFLYFSGRINEIGPALKSRLKIAQFVPINRTTVGKEHQTKLLPPNVCYIGGESSPYRTIFDFVDFGAEANTFLLFCGAKSEPSIQELAYRVASQPAKVLDTFGDVSKYLVLLKMIGSSYSDLKRDSRLIQMMKGSEMLIAYREMKADTKSKDVEATVREVKLARASETIVIDDFISFELFKTEVLAAPQDDEIERFYARLGAVYLSAKVSEQNSIGSRMHDPKLCADLKKLIVERSRLFLHSNKESVARDYRWLEKSVQIEVVDRIKHRRDLILDTKRVHHERTVTAAVVWRNNLPILHVTPDFRFFDLASVLVGLLLVKPPAHSGLIMESLLSTDLLELRRRGFNVDRILEAKQEEARLAEEMRLKKAEENRRKIEEQERKFQEEEEAMRKSLRAPPSDAKPEEKAPTSMPAMPGGFGDSPPPRRPAPPPPAPEQSIFKRFTRKFGLDDDRKQEEQIQSLLGNGSKSSIGSSTSTAVDKMPHPPQQAVRQPEKPTSHHRISKNLHNAIDSARPHNSTEVVSKGKSYDVKEEAQYCDSTPSTNITCVAETPSGMKVFLSKDLVASQSDLLQAYSQRMNQFSMLLKQVAEIYNLSLSSLHIFYDESGSTIAFNTAGSLFFNFRFYQSLHCKDDSSESKKQALIYWFTVTAHELAHNLVGPHNAEHSFYTESFVQEYFLRAAELLARED